MGDTDGPLSGQLECDSDSDTEDRKVTPIFGSTKLIDFGPPDQPRELRIASSLSPDERSRLINLLRFKNARATYHRAATTLFHDMMHRDIEVYVDDMIVKSRERANHLTALQRFFERIRHFRLRLNPKKCTLGVTSGKLLGHIVSEHGIEVDPKKIRVILDMPAPRTEREIRSFLGKLQYISRFIARLTDISEPIFLLLRKNQPIVWNNDCQRAFEKIKECLLSPPVLVPPTLGLPLLLYLFVSDMALGCMLAQLDDSGKEQAIYYLSKRMLKYECRYIMIERLCLALVWATRRLRHYKSVKWSIVADHLASLPVSDDRPIDDDFPDEHFVSMTNIAGWQLYFDGVANQSGFGIGLETTLDLRVRQLEIHEDSNLFVDALATLASVIEIPTGVTVQPLLIETRPAPAYCCLIGDIEDQDELSWYHDIYQFLLCGAYPESASTKDRKALRSSDERGSCRSLWLTRGRTYVGPKDYEDRLFLVDHGGRLLPIRLEVPKVLDARHEYILVVVDYFTKWVEAASYARLTAARVAKFIRSHIIYRYGVLHELISDREVHFRGEVDTLIQEYGIQHHRSSATSFRTSTEATLYSLVYGMEAVLPIDIEMGFLGVALEQQISET
ncbi:uncharacterized protein LOC117908248 [Vitis riparia]|uniref:uncharacterized protein LOC117908248 n=1 Tax=Vitis riparia TaxID=96939 RepID=UPI00155A8F72|nr:uncharacterized protein LOC117908248 [Vitis riparia]